ncbi:MAG: hypothetical protein K2Q22_02460, partial [Cytophagales bacterium]|nr:hypothetical protein [Cytophagales bacterium]
MSKVQEVVFGGKERIRFDLSGLDNSAFDLVDRGDSLFKVEFRCLKNMPLRFTFPELANGICWYCFGPVYAWVVPARFNSSIYTIDRIQFMLLQYEDGTYGAIFPVNHKENSFLSFQDGVCQVRFDDDKDSIHHDFHLAIYFHSNPYLAINQVVDLGLSVLDQVRNEQILPDFFHYLGWCSWNAFGYEVSHSRLIEAAHSFREADLNIRWMIIDDGWMSVTGPYGSGILNSFHPNSDKFPKGLANVIFEL